MNVNNASAALDAQVELIGKEQVEGADAYKIKVTMKSGQIRYLYLDTESKLEIKSEIKRTVRGTEVEGETLFGDYKDEGGLMMAHTIENGIKGSPQRQKMVLEKIELNADLPDSLFALPAGAKPAVATPKADAAKSAKDSAKADAAKKDAPKKKP